MGATALDTGRSYALGLVPPAGDAPPKVAPGLEPVSVDPRATAMPDFSAKYPPRCKVAPKRSVGPVHPKAFKSAARPGARKLKIGGSVKGIRGERPPLMKHPVEVKDSIVAGEVVRRQRRALGHTANSVCTAVNMWPANLLKLERGHSDIRLNTLVRLCDGLGLKVIIAPK